MSRFKRIAAVTSAVGLASVGLAASASADHVVDGAWDSTSYNLTCHDPSEGSVDGGRLLTRLHGEEVRAVADDFLTTSVETHWVAWKYIGGGWVPLQSGPVRTGGISDARFYGGMYHAPFEWSHFVQQRHPRFYATVPTNGTWLLTVETDVYQEDGVQVATLVNTTETCTFGGKK